MRQEIHVKELGDTVAHFTDAVRCGDLLFVSGILPVDAQRRVVGGDDVAAQTRQIFKNMAQVLQAAGAGFADVLKVTVYLTDIADRAKIIPVRLEVFGRTKPASTLVGVTGLAVPGAKIEIDAIVGLPRSR